MADRIDTPRWGDRWGYRRIVADIRTHIEAGRAARPGRKPCPTCGQPLTAVALKPGDQLLSRSQLADWYDVSEATVGNALRVLADAGDTIGEAGVGVYVTPDADA